MLVELREEISSRSTDVGTRIGKDLKGIHGLNVNCKGGSLVRVINGHNIG